MKMMRLTPIGRLSVWCTFLVSAIVVVSLIAGFLLT
jgi:hypothetical protein